MAAVIDIAVVAIGILMALALDDWNSDREAAAIRLDLLKLARDEVVNNEQTVGSDVEELEQDLADLAEAYAVIADTQGPSVLSDNQCEAILLSHIVPNSTWVLPTVERLVTTQQLNAHEDFAVRAAAQDFLDALGYQKSEELRASANTINVSTMHPGLISVRLTADKEPRAKLIEAQASEVICNLQEVRESDAFKTSLSYNYRVIGVLTNGAKGNVQKRVGTLRLALDERLGITRE